MVAVDYILLAVLVISTAVSVLRGFVKEAISLVSWAVAIWCAWRFGGAVAGALEGSIDSMTSRLWVARSLLLVGVLVAGGLVEWLVLFLLQKSGLTGTDRAIGTVFGFARGVILAGLLVAVLQSGGFEAEPWWQDSKLIRFAEPVADMLRDAAEEGFEYLDVD
ncbi:MAG: CvpA family protein [Gammaproteobacteria bacterium]|nr:CvpA family protein [Gammaproteobacteria bacterium]